VVIDIHIPQRTGEDAAAAHGLGLIREICTNSSFYKPNMVLGITSDVDRIEEFRSEVRAENVRIDGYSQDSDTWLGIIDFAITNILRDNSNNVDILYITTTETEEQAILHSNKYEWQSEKECLEICWIIVLAVL